ncbi:MAG: UxaA family hydrolase [Thermomicrobiales bacterium]|nr:UxaA family hydrolase [Thermomicrobiales bacterium]
MADGIWRPLVWRKITSRCGGIRHESGRTTCEQLAVQRVGTFFEYTRAGFSRVIGVSAGRLPPRERRHGIRREQGTMSAPDFIVLHDCDNVATALLGRGTVTGSGIVPVIKVCGNPETYARMSENMDVNAGSIVTGARTIAEVGDEILAAIQAVAGGAMTKNEELGHFEFHI